jgi:hypothetical protein
MTAVNQDLPDWTKVIYKAHSILQLDKEKNSDTENINPRTLTEDQRIGRELYMFVQRHERKTLAYQIYANVGLACLGIRRLLQVHCFSLTIFHSNKY